MRDIIAFVKEKQIAGKSFLRLNEGDLEGSVFFFSSFSLFLPNANDWFESKV